MLAKPPFGRRLDRNHPLSQELVLCLPLSEMAGPARNLVNPALLTDTTAPTWGVTPYGASGREWLAANAISAALAFTSGRYSVAVLVYLPRALASGEFIHALDRFAYVSESENSGWAVRGFNSDFPTLGWAFEVFSNNSADLYRLSSAVTPVPGLTLVVATSESTGALRRIYVNGIEKGSTSSTPNPASTTAPFQSYTNGAAGLAHVLIAYAWARCLTGPEVWSLYANPYVVFAPARRQLFAGAPAGSSNRPLADSRPLAPDRPLADSRPLAPERPLV
jgi:hypothetical protein